MRPVPLQVSMDRRTLSLGQYVNLQSPELIEVIGHCGYNHVIIDQMFTALDWQVTANLVRAAQLFGVSAVVRVQSYPFGGDGADMSSVSSVARALGIGADGAMVSIGGLEELERCLRVQRDAHHGRIWISPDVAELEAGKAAHAEHAGPGFFVIPLIEMAKLVDQVDTLMSLEGLRCVGVGIHDICAAVGQPFKVEHPDVWAVIDKLVAAGRRNNVDVWVNTGYRFATVPDIAARIDRLWDRGVCTIQVQGPETLLQHTLNGIRRASRAASDGAANVATDKDRGQ